MSFWATPYLLWTEVETGCEIGVVCWRRWSFVCHQQLLMSIATSVDLNCNALPCLYACTRTVGCYLLSAVFYTMNVGDPDSSWTRCRGVAVTPLIATATPGSMTLSAVRTLPRIGRRCVICILCFICCTEIKKIIDTIFRSICRLNVVKFC